MPSGGRFPRIVRFGRGEHADPRHPRRLLRARRQRHRCRPTKSRDEFPPPHVLPKQGRDIVRFIQVFRKRLDVRYGSGASFLACPGDVCLSPVSDGIADAAGSPVRANRRHRTYSITSSARASSDGGTNTKRLRGLEVDHQLKLDRLLNWQVVRLGTAQNAIDIGCRPSKIIDNVYSVGQQPSLPRKIGKPEDRRQPMTIALPDDQIAVGG